MQHSRAHQLLSAECQAAGTILGNKLAIVDGSSTFSLDYINLLLATECSTTTAASPAQATCASQGCLHNPLRCQSAATAAACAPADPEARRQGGSSSRRSHVVHVDPVAAQRIYNYTWLA
jgi:hypothetical protein